MRDQQWDGMGKEEGLPLYRGSYLGVCQLLCQPRFEPGFESVINSCMLDQIGSSGSSLGDSLRNSYQIKFFLNLISSPVKLVVMEMEMDCEYGGCLETTSVV